MSTAAQVSDVEMINLTLMLALRAAVVESPTQASYQYDLGPEEVAFFASLDLATIHVLVANVDRCLFRLRPGLPQLAAVPPGLASVLAVVRNGQGQRTIIEKPSH